MKDLKVVFMGTPQFSTKVLEMLIIETDVVLVVTKEDKCVGRKREIEYSPIKQLALENNIEVFQPNNIKTDYQRIIDVNPDIIITCAYGQIIPEILLNYPKLGSINVHASLLPKLRGGAPIHKAIIEDYSKTGITIMYMGKKMDNGDIISQSEINIKETDNYSSLHDKLSIIGRDLLKDTLPSIINGSNNRIKQIEEEVTFAYTIKREEELLDFNNETVRVYNKIRGLANNPYAYAMFDEKEIKICEAIKLTTKYDVYIPGVISNIYKNGIGVMTNDGEIIITKVKPAGKKIMNTSEFLNGIKNKSELIGKYFN